MSTGTGPAPPGAAAVFRTLELRVRRSVAGRLQGDNSGLRLGPGGDPEEVVRYRPGEDDVRRIDWNVTARSSEPHVWRSRAEHELDTWVLLDRTASMDFGTAACEKRDLAAQAVAAVALMTDRPGNRVGVVRLGPLGLRWTSPAAGRVCASSVLHRADERVAPATGGPSLSDALDQLDRRHRRSGLRVVVSDLLEPDGRVERPFPWERSLRRLAARHETMVLEVLDPRELELVDVGPVVLEDPETGHRCEVWTSLPRVREAYAVAAAAHREATAAAVTAAGATHVRLRTDRDWVRDLVQHVVRRRRMPARRPVGTTP